MLRRLGGANAAEVGRGECFGHSCGHGLIKGTHQRHEAKEVEKPTSRRSSRERCILYELVER
jgi:hypothetical protein